MRELIFLGCAFGTLAAANLPVQAQTSGCKYNFTFHMGTPGVFPAIIDTVPGYACRMPVTMRGGSTLSSVAIISRPRHGSAVSMGRDAIVYQAPVAFTGKDEFLVRFTGANASGPGSATVKFQVRVAGQPTVAGNKTRPATSAQSPLLSGRNACRAQVNRTYGGARTRDGRIELQSYTAYMLDMERCDKV